eukprot:TRINITY_DN14605_c0_g1_i1.p1 TRINITY_DN14605_c0_g1~~TRINITY_DN14605_c0_g1_i1.p1  ORF type:complete len:133 (-),score=36.02 TRINITY_DN14605_c0_g1_i1:49-447(-)
MRAEQGLNDAREGVKSNNPCHIISVRKCLDGVVPVDLEIPPLQVNVCLDKDPVLKSLKTLGCVIESSELDIAEEKFAGGVCKQGDKTNVGNQSRQKEKVVKVTQWPSEEILVAENRPKKVAQARRPDWRRNE